MTKMTPAIERASVVASKVFPTRVVDGVLRLALGLTRRKLRPAPKG